MNTKRLALLLMGIMLLSCSTSEDGPIHNNPPNNGVESSYSILLSKEGYINSTGFEANAVDISDNGIENPLVQSQSGMLYYRKGNSFSFLNSLPGCNAEIQYWKPGGSLVTLADVFPDDDNCEREILAFAHTDNSAFIAYGLPGEGMKEVLYFIRALQFDGGDPVFDDIAMEQEPVQLITSGNRLYILRFDNLSGKNVLEVVNATTGIKEKEGELGTDVVKVLSTAQGQVLVSYEGKHMVLDPNSLEVLSRVQYISGKEPNFAHSESHYFGHTGVLYYAMPTNLPNSAANHIPAVYDFAKYTAYLYFYENFLSEARLADYDVGDTRSVAFDHKNGLLLIGYEKAKSAGKGGLLRVKPVPEPEFIDQTDLDGVPLYLWAE